MTGNTQSIDSAVPNKRFRPVAALAFAGGVLAIGIISAFIGFLLTDPSRSVQTLPTLLSLPPWFFWVVWIVIYPALGVATYLVWQTPTSLGRRMALVYFTLYLASNIAFLPINALIPGVWTAFTLDVIGGIAGIGLAVAFYRVAPRSLPWLLPLLVWLPITTANKVPAILHLLG
jgi:tryptophan-rich sensory protein